MALEKDLTAGVPDEEPTQPEQGSVAGDTLKTLGGAVVRQTGEGIGLFNDATGAPQTDRPVQDLFSTAADVIENARSPTAKKIASADVTTSEGRNTLLKNPGRALAVKAAEIVPSLLQAAALPEGWAGVGAGSGFFATQGVAQQLSAIHKRIAETPDDELQATVPLYKAFRADHDETSSRQALADAQNDLKTLMTVGSANAVAGGALGLMLKGPTSRSLVKSLLGGVGEGALGMGVAGAGSDVASQQARVATGEQPGVDPGEAVAAGLNSAATGGVLGAVTGGIRGAVLPTKVKAPTVDKDIATGRVVPTGHPDPAQQAALDQSQKGTEPPTPIKGTLADQIAQEEQGGTTTPATAQPAAPPDATSSPVAPPVEAPPAGVAATPPEAAPPAPATPTAATVPPVVGQAPEPPIPLPPTDRTNLPPRQKAPAERQAVPLEEPPVPLPPAKEPPTPEAPTPVTKAEAETITASLPKREEALSARVEPTSGSDVTPPVQKPVSPIFDALNKAVGEAEKPAEVTPAKIEPAKEEQQPLAALVDTTKEGQKVFRNQLTELVAEARATEKAKADEQAKRQSEADRKREARFNQQGENEAKAESIVTATHPTDAERLQEHHAIEQQALGEGAGANAAREVLKGRAAEMLTTAENSGVRLVERTRPTAEQAAAGETNPTPYTSRLSEVRKFLNLERLARRQFEKDPAKLEKRLRELYEEHIVAERALRAGDLQGAAARRLEANERLNARHKAGRVKEETQRTADEQAELDKLIGEQSDESESRTKKPSRKTKVEHYEIPRGAAERVSSVAEEMGQLQREFDPATLTSPKHKAMASLLRHIMGRFSDRVGSTAVRFLADEHLKAEHGVGVDAETGDHVNGKFKFFPGGVTREGDRGVIFIDNDLVHTEDGPRVILHEVAHAATNHGIMHNPRLRADLEAVHGEAKTAWEAIHGDYDKTGEGYAYGLHSYEYLADGTVRPDTREFVAEAWAEPALRGVLLRTKASPELARRLQLQKGSSLWRAMLSSISRALGLGEQHYTLMDAIAHLTDEAMNYDPPIAENSSVSRLHEPRIRYGEHRHASRDIVQSFSSGNRTGEMLQRAVEEAPRASEVMRSKVRALGLHLGTTHQVAQMAEPYFGEGSPAMKLWAAAKKMVHSKGEIIEASGARKLMGDLAKLERKLTPDAMDEFGNFLRDETMAGVYADRPLDKQKGVTSQGKAQYAKLAERYNGLSTDAQAMRLRLHDYFKAQQKEAALSTLKAVIRAINPNGEADDALAEKIFNKTLSDAEKRVLDRHNVMSAIRNARDLQKVTGPYVPLMRHGDHVVTGTYNVAAPLQANGKRAMRLNEEGVQDAKGNVYQFDTKADAEAFAGSAPVKVTREQHVYTDPATGSRHAVDPATGEKTRLTKEDWAANTADEKWRVTLQPEHAEFFDREMDARRRHAELAAHDWAKEGLEFNLDGVAPRRWEPAGSNASFMSGQWDKALNSLRQRGGFQSLDPTARRELENHLVELSLSSLGSTRAQSRRLPRTFVKGASGDIQRGLGQYASSMSGFLARQKYAPEVDAHMKTLQKYERDHAYEGSEKTYPRGQILKELQQRLYAQGEPERLTKTDTVIGRLLQMSQLDKLASPAFHIINSMEPWTTSMPVIGGKYGFGKALVAMHSAYADIGAPTILGKGLRDTVKAFRETDDLTDYIKTLKERVASKRYGSEFGDVLDEMGHLGVISRDAGMETQRQSTPGSKILGRGLDRADIIARQMGTAVESINRFVTARAEYMLARQSGLDHEAAKQAAIDRTVNTMGDYSQWNASPIFKHPLGRLALQFKKFAQKTYYLLGKTALQAFRGDPEGMKAFAGLMATHGLLAGALGLPLEAIHVGMLAAQLTGITSNNYGDFEQWMRKKATEAGQAMGVGTGFGEISMRGLPRYLGVDVSSRFSLADLVFPLGDPKSLKQDDLLAYAAKAFGGAPLSLLAEYPAGVKALLDGDFANASRVLVPIKAYSDAMTAYQRASVGRQTVGGREKMSPYTPGEAVTRSLGFAPAREAEAMEAYNAQYGDQQAFKKQRSTLMNNYVNGKGVDKANALKAINEWNAKQPPAAKITPGEAERAVIRRQREEHDEKFKGGLRTTKRDEFIRQDASYYNLR
jgi:hypothetical protein